jgi:type IV pilus assembly protein PilV
MSARRQLGTTLVEVMIAIIVFSVGILAMMRLHAASVANSGAAKYRTDASFLANQLFGHMWTHRATLEATPTQFAHRPDNGTGATLCQPTGSAATHAAVTGWLADVAATLPGAVADRQQVRVEANQRVVVTICWKIPSEAGWRNHIEVAQLVGSAIN